MSEYDNNMRGVLWFVKEKKTDKHPDFTGSMEINGKEYLLSGWKGSGKKPAVSFTIKEKEQAQTMDVGYDNNPIIEDLDDDVPF